MAEANVMTEESVISARRERRNQSSTDTERLNAKIKISKIKAGKTIWLLEQQIEKVLLDCGINIFGGYVRDKIQHNYFAKRYYNHHNSLPNSNITLNHITKNYSDPDYLPEFIERLCVPSDIDCFVQSLDLKKLKETLLEKCSLFIVSKSDGPAKFYIKNIEQNQMLNETVWHTKLQIGVSKNTLVNNSRYNIKVDIIHNNTIDSDFDIQKFITSRIDFECNSLIITSNHDYSLAQCVSAKTAQDKHEKISQIIDDIINKKAVSINDTYLLHYRVELMLNKKWSIHGETLDVLSTFGKEIIADDICLICHEQLNENEYYLKHNLCSVIYHAKCHNDMIEDDHFKHECPACKEYYTSNDDNLVLSVMSINENA